MMAKTYKKKLVEPLFDLLKNIAVKLLKEYLKLKSRYIKIGPLERPVRRRARHGGGEHDKLPPAMNVLYV